ncbi:MULTISPECIES: BolA family transcriptional regulator [unclassified Oceanobacter]|jgi:BolA protein|uniref:BolA family protein n=1 Tax=unclassified Oceanobacter TaxID=2620260 RepID=UPI0026E3B83E|nr:MULTISPECIES: BolA family protein [unclassified Oceanobacter]MDO6683510.1 BolA family protein [Oceanobacter sp. 5_MG-2023]MDP2547364.1 BolA family protein [Oceanobacter sp. 4_MG-2023]MDP2607490.1 BolA family protein [Oceanobacter sp. 1_MG-2023]MDP2610758.1 BolA family protein [Oceanobacter sp. 2_MG-2023]
MKPEEYPEEYIVEQMASLSPSHLELMNESHMHAGPATTSHYKLVMVSDAFEGKRPVARHQLVYGLVADILQNPVHALALHLYSPQEWQAQTAVPESPQCAGQH